MAHPPMILAYFGPEVQLPLISLIGSIVGLVLMAGSFPIRLIKQKVRDWKRLGAIRGSKR